jgi:hypothetical protein
MHLPADGSIIKVVVANPPGSVAEHFAGVDHPPTGVH